VTHTCGHCGQTCGDYAGGYGGVTREDGSMVHLCHPNDPVRPDCYRRVTVYHEPLGNLLGDEVLPPGITGIISAPEDEWVFYRELAYRLSRTDGH
jgi:hypothetical protein